MLFSAVSLLLLAYTNRFLVTANRIRELCLKATPLMLCALVIAVERQNFLRGALFGLGVPLIADFLFGYFLKSPLPRSLFGF